MNILLMDRILFTIVKKSGFPKCLSFYLHPTHIIFGVHKNLSSCFSAVYQKFLLIVIKNNQLRRNPPPSIIENEMNFNPLKSLKTIAQTLSKIQNQYS